MISDEAKREALIEKAMTGGWSPTGRNLREYIIGRLNFADLMYNHDFVKALYGHKIVHGDGTLESLSAWRYHIQQAVVTDDPLSYMYKEVFGDG